MPDMYGCGKSDGRIVPKKQPNKGGTPLAEAVEGRRPAKGNAPQTPAYRTQSRRSATNGLGGMREAARRDGRWRLDATTRGRSRMRESCTYVSVRGGHG